MPKRIADQRTRLLGAAKEANYRYGFGNTAIADITKEGGIPLGNVYYYFKTKDEIAGAAIDLRVRRFRKLVEEFDKTPSPDERLSEFVNVKLRNGPIEESNASRRLRFRVSSRGHGSSTGRKPSGGPSSVKVKIAVVLP